MLRFGVLVPGETLHEWEARCIARLRSAEGVECAVAFVRSDDLGITPGRAGSRRGHEGPGALRPVRLDEALADVERCVAGPSPTVLAGRLASSGLDFLVAFAMPRVPPEAPVLSHGVWSFRFGRDFSGADELLGEREITAGEKMVEGRLVRLTERSDRVIVLEEGVLGVRPHSIRKTRDRLLYTCAEWPARLCRRILAGETGASAPGPPVAADPAGQSGGWIRGPLHGLRRGMRLGVGAVARVTREFREERWNIGIVDVPIATFAGGALPSSVRWLPETRRDGCIADPCALPGSTLILAEWYDYRREKGLIAAIDLADADPAPRIVLEREGHLAYPYLVAENGDIYCVPETNSERRVVLLRADPFPDRWVEDTVLVPDFAGVDATLFRHGDFWWILCTNQDDEPNAKLHGFHAPSLRGPWSPHPLNPLKCDVRSARPAGTPFVHGGALHRPAQDCSRWYGSAVVINRVRRLDPVAFEEEVIARVAPDPGGPFPHGLHTLTSLGDRTLLDGKRHFVSLPRGLRAVLRALSRRARSTRDVLDR